MEEGTHKDDTEEPKVLEMSDEDFMKAEAPVSLEDEANATTSEDVSGTEEGDTPSDEEDKASSDTDGEPSDEDTGDEDESTGSTDVEDEPDKADGTEVEDESSKTSNSEESTDSNDPIDNDTSNEEQTAIDYKSELERVMAPFIANGSEMTPKSTDDVIRLMQMGANYHKKMAGLKPAMKTLKLLEKNGIVDPDDLNFLIDLKNKNPDAITKLLKDSNIDPLEVDLKKDVEYTPTSHTVGDAEVELDMVLASIKSTPSYAKTLNVITEQWDDASRNVLATTPNIIAVINGQVADGTFDKVMGAVDYERSLGQLQGISDLDAYKQMGDSLQQQGKLGPLPNASNSDTPKKVAPVKKAPSSSDKVRKAKKKAASPTHSSSSDKTGIANFNPLAMSDEEIENFDMSKLPKN